MNNILNRLTFPVAIAALTLGVSCSEKPKTDQFGQQVPTLSVFMGNWMGKDKKGDIYRFSFDKKGTWESNIEKSGSSRGLYRGTFTHDGSSVVMRITEEWDLKTSAWVKEKGNMSDNVTGRLSNNFLRIPGLTEAELMKR